MTAPPSRMVSHLPSDSNCRDRACLRPRTIPATTTPTSRISNKLIGKSSIPEFFQSKSIKTRLPQNNSQNHAKSLWLEAKGFKTSERRLRKTKSKGRGGGRGRARKD